MFERFKTAVAEAHRLHSCNSGRILPPSLVPIGMDSLWIRDYEEAMSVLTTCTYPLNVVFRRGLVHSLSITGAAVAKESLVRTYLLRCTVLQRTALHCTALHCTALHSSVKVLQYYHFSHFFITFSSSIFVFIFYFFISLFLLYEYFFLNSVQYFHFSFF